MYIYFDKKKTNKQRFSPLFLWSVLSKRIIDGLKIKLAMTLGLLPITRWTLYSFIAGRIKGG